MIGIVAPLKVRHGLKIAVVSNEARELNAYRIQKFKLDGLVDFFISFCFVQIRKPDADILALDIPPGAGPASGQYRKHPEVCRDRRRLGIRSILHTDYRSSCAQLATLGLLNDERTSHETG